MEKLEYVYYEYKEETYKVHRVVEAKCPVNREWFKAVYYSSVDNISYVREYKDFIDKFKPVMKNNKIKE